MFRRATKANMERGSNSEISIWSKPLPLWGLQGQRKETVLEKPRSQCLQQKQKLYWSFLKGTYLHSEPLGGRSWGWGISAVTIDETTTMSSEVEDYLSFSLSPILSMSLVLILADSARRQWATKLGMLFEGSGPLQRRAEWARKVSEEKQANDQKRN